MCGGSPATLSNLLKKQSCMSFFNLIDYARRQHRPIVLFPEGTTTNGRGLLQFIAPKMFDPWISELANEPKNTRSTVKLHIYALKYIYTDMSPSFTVGSKVKHLFQVVLQVRIIQALYIWLTSVAVPQYPWGKICPHFRLSDRPAEVLPDRLVEAPDWFHFCTYVSNDSHSKGRIVRQRQNFFCGLLWEEELKWETLIYSWSL